MRDETSGEGQRRRSPATANDGDRKSQMMTRVNARLATEQTNAPGRGAGGRRASPRSPASVRTRGIRRGGRRARGGDARGKLGTPSASRDAALGASRVSRAERYARDIGRLSTHPQFPSSTSRRVAARSWGRSHCSRRDPARREAAETGCVMRGEGQRVFRGRKITSRGPGRPRGRRRSDAGNIAPRSRRIDRDRRM